MADLGNLLRIQMMPYGEWDLFRRAFVLGGYKKRVVTIMTDTPKKWAAIAEAKIASSLLTGRYDSMMNQPNRLSDVTIMLKGQGIPLIQSRQLYKSITRKKFSDGSWFGGIDPNAFHSGAQMPVWQLAMIQEQGISIGVTEKMRGWFHSRGVNLKKTTSAIVIPARPFIKQGILDTLKEFKKESAATARELIERLG
jgi:hypothetical protein